MGITLRILLAVNALAFLSVLAHNHSSHGLLLRVTDLAVWVEPILLTSLFAVCVLRRALLQLPYRIAFTLVLSLVATIAWCIAVAFEGALEFAVSPWQPVFWSILVTIALIGWFTLQQQARSPALTEARLMALTARIRPHFLFNSLNAVLGVIRTDPRRAEAALEELAELFRAMMQDPRDFVLLSDEIALSRRYLDLERLRLGERLKVEWDIESCPPDALMPPLMLQPLLENAVYHGIEPTQNPGTISIRLAQVDNQVRIELSNPLEPGHSHDKGNQMAQANIRERLMLFYDLEASLSTEITHDSYAVRINIPYRRT